MSLNVPSGQHVNKVPFTGILANCDTPSTRPPGGASGHQVILSSAVAERCLSSLLGMGVNTAPNMREHAPQRKIGLIATANVVNGDLEVAGFLYGKNFPAEIAQLRRQQGQLGMSFEISDVIIRDDSAPVWDIQHCTFTGCAILAKTSAAFQQTCIAL